MMPRALQITALPIANNLAKLQTKRYLKGDNCRTFLDLADTERWLATVRGVAPITA